MVIIQKNMNAPSSEIIVVWGRREIGGKPNHGGNHLAHLVQSGVPTTSLDILPIKEECEWIITHVQWTLEEYLKSWIPTPRWVLISTPDECHIADLRASIEAGVKVILVEKPIGLSVDDYREFQRLCALTKEQWQIIMSCLPRLADTPYRHLTMAMPELINLYGNIVEISHTFGFHKEVNKGFAGQDHIAHEITTVMQILWYTWKIEDIQIHITKSSADTYSCYWWMGGVHFTIGGNKKSTEKYEQVTIKFEKGTAHLDAANGKFTHSSNSWGQKFEYDAGKSNPVDRLTTVSRNFAEVALGTDGVKLYLPNNSLAASAFFPSTLDWWNPIAGS